RGKTVGKIRGAPGGGVAAVGPAGDADLLFVHQAHFDEVIDAVDEVVELLAARVALSLHGEFDAVTGGAAIVGIEHRHPPGSGDLAERMIERYPAVGVVRLRAAVDRQY